MKLSKITQILSETSYARTSGTAQEKQCAEYIKSLCDQMFLSARIEPFDITMHKISVARLIVDGKEIACTGFGGAASATVSEKLYYLQSNDPVSLKRCKDKIVLVGKSLDIKLYDALAENGAKGLITYNGNLAFNDKDIYDNEIRFKISEKNLLPVVNIHLSDAVDIVKKGSKSAQIILQQADYVGKSYNVILDIEGQTKETIIICAHYDTTSLSTGAYDNMSGCIALLYLAEYFSTRQNFRSIRLLWCGSEERGLYGSLEYCNAHREELQSHILNINLDMLGSVMGEFVAFSCINEKVKDIITSFLSKHCFPGSTRHAIRSSDSNSFVYNEIPAISFARYAPMGLTMIHSRYDDMSVVSEKQLLKDSQIIAKFVEYVANKSDLSEFCTISDKIKTDVYKYMERHIACASNKRD